MNPADTLAEVLYPTLRHFFYTWLSGFLQPRSRVSSWATHIGIDFAADSLDNRLRDTSKVDLTKSLNIDWVGPSLTPQGSPSNVNPAWSYYEVDRRVYSITNNRTYYSDISQVNRNWTMASFELEYDVRKAYHHTSTSPQRTP